QQPVIPKTSNSGWFTDHLPDGWYMTTQRRLRWGKKPKQDTPRSILVDDQDGAVEATEFVYAVAAALGLVPRQRTEAANEPRVVKIAVIGTTLHAEDRQWHYLE